MGEIGISNSAPIYIWCDNIGATYLAAYPVSLQRTKHIEIDIYFVQDLVAQRKLFARHIASSLQFADILTKVLPISYFRSLRDKLTVASTMSLRGMLKVIISKIIHRA